MAEKGFDLLIIDYLQLMETGKRQATGNEKVTYISQSASYWRRLKNSGDCVEPGLKVTQRAKNQTVTSEGIRAIDRMHVVIFLSRSCGNQYTEGQQINYENM